MFCKHCGAQIKDGSKFCSVCGGSQVPTPTQQATSVQPVQQNTPSYVPNSGANQTQINNNLKKKNHKKMPLIIIAIILVISLVAGCVTFLIINFQIEKEVKLINEVSDSFYDVEEDYLVDGYVPIENLDALMEAETAHAQSLVDDGTATDINVDDTSGTILVELKTGDDYLYIPSIQDARSSGSGGRIVTLQPNLDDFPDNCTDDVAKKISKKYSHYSFSKSDNYDLKEVSLKNLAKLQGSELVLWDGHGAYNSKIGPALITGTSAKEAKLLKKTNPKFRKDIYYPAGKKGDDSVPVAIVREFFENHYDENDLDGCLFWLGTCGSGKDDTLADAILSRGASTVLVSTNTINNWYLDSIIETTSKYLLKGYTIGDALDTAKEEHGEHDSRFYSGSNPLKTIDILFNPARVEIVGDENFVLNDAPAESNSDNENNSNGALSISNISVEPAKIDYGTAQSTYVMNISFDGSSDACLVGVEITYDGEPETVWNYYNSSMAGVSVFTYPGDDYPERIRIQMGVGEVDGCLEESGKWYDVDISEALEHYYNDSFNSLYMGDAGIESLQEQGYILID